MTVAALGSLPAAQPWRRRARGALVAALFDLALYNLYQVTQSPTRWPDFAFFYAFARAGVIEGYRRVYDPVVQQHWIQQLFPGAPFYVVVNPPPFSWVLAPLALLPFGLALWIWTLSMIAALAISSQLLAPPGRFLRLVYLGLWLAFLPAYLVFVSAPLAPLVILSLALAWKFVRDDHQVAAGLVLAVGLLKPTLAILVPVALLAAGYRRTFMAWLAAALAAVGASCLVLGPDGIRAYIALTLDFAANAYYLRWSLVPIVGGGVAWAVAVVAITLAIIWLAWRTRQQGLEITISIGVMGSLLINHHMTPGDLMMLLLPVWLLLRAGGSLVRDGALALAWVGGWLSLIFPVLVIVVASATPAAIFVDSLRSGRRLRSGPSELAREAAR